MDPKFEIGETVAFVTEHGAVLRSGGVIEDFVGAYTVTVAWPAQGSLPAATLRADRESLVTQTYAGKEI